VKFILRCASLAFASPSVWSNTLNTNDDMSDKSLHIVDWALPSPPLGLMQLTGLLAQPVSNVVEIGEVIESDISLASAVLKTVNSSMFGMSGRVQTVREAITYLGTREVCAITLQHGLRAAFPSAIELDLLWQRAVTRGVVMGWLGQALASDAWTAHSAGLFEEAGKALLFRHAPSGYGILMAKADGDDRTLIASEQEAYGVSHDTLGAALCETWGLSPAAVYCVRHHVDVQSSFTLPRAPRGHRFVCALSALAQFVIEPARSADLVVGKLAEQLDMNPQEITSAIHLAQTHFADGGRQASKAAPSA
jgi:HD-like signal output (HDOD) protein